MTRNPIKTTAQNSYQAYMIRLWQEESGGQWLITLESVASSERRAFRGMEVFIQHFRTLTEKRSEAMQAEKGA